MAKKRRAKPDWTAGGMNSRFQKVASAYLHNRYYPGKGGFYRGVVRYKYYGAYDSKKKVQKQRDWLKKMGYLARIEQSPKVMRSVDPKTGKYFLYYRRTRRSKPFPWAKKR